jgi:hypothetical protein
MRTNLFRSNKPAQGFWNDDRQQQRHFFNRALSVGWVTTRGEEPMKLSELAYITLCRGLGFHKGAEMEAFAHQQEHDPLFDKDGINFLYFWEHVLKNGPVRIDRIEFNQSGTFVTVYEETPKGVQAREFKNSRSKYPRYGSAVFAVSQMALAHLHSASIESNTNAEAKQMSDEDLKALISKQ